MVADPPLQIAVDPQTGEIDESSLEGLPEEIRERVLSPEFRTQVRARVFADRIGGRRLVPGPIKFTLVPRGHRIQMRSQKARVPELSGRQRRIVRKLARRVTKKEQP